MDTFKTSVFCENDWEATIKSKKNCKILPIFIKKDTHNVALAVAVASLALKIPF